MFFIPAFPSFSTILSLILIVWPRGGAEALVEHFRSLASSFVLVGLQLSRDVVM